MKYLKSFKTLKQYDDKKQRLSKPIISFCKENKALYYAWKELNPTSEEFKFRTTAGEIRDIEKSVARITKVKGNSVVWNQAVNSDTWYKHTSNGITFETLDGKLIANGTATKTASYGIGWNAIKGHKYAMLGCPSGGGENTYRFYNQGSALDYGNGVIYTEGRNSGTVYNVIDIMSGVTANNLIFTPRIYDLTQMFGAGNEPTTIEDFYARIPQGMDPYAYNKGEIVNMNVDAIKTVGLNQWDEQWEQGTITISEGQDYESTTMIRSANYIKVMPTTLYFYTLLGIARNATFIYFYDYDFGYLGYVEKYDNVRQFTFTTPVNCRFIRFVEQSSNTYNHDICINLSHTGYKNGTYEPYETFTRDISWVKKYFPNGMKSAGNVRDEIRFDSSLQKWVAVQNVGSVDLGGLGWFYQPSSVEGRMDRFASNTTVNSKYVDNQTNVTCARFTPSIDPIGGRAVDKTISVYSNGYIYLIDTTYTDGALLKDSLQGVELYYELAEPIITPINDEIENSYTVWDLGTEEAISETPSTIFNGDIIYKYKPE